MAYYLQILERFEKTDWTKLDEQVQEENELEGLLKIQIKKQYSTEIYSNSESTSSSDLA